MGMGVGVGVGVAVLVGEGLGVEEGWGVAVLVAVIPTGWQAAKKTAKPKTRKAIRNISVDNRSVVNFDAISTPPM